MEDPVVAGIARRLGVHPATVCLKWALRRGAVTIPLSTKRSNYLANLRAALPPDLADDDMASLATIDKGCRLVKGQVFCWRKGQSWEDLWDEDGVIAT
jgi:diketogulonate reductase-like aldo/keto reductase